MVIHIAQIISNSLPIYIRKDGEDLNLFFSHLENISTYRLTDYERFIYLQSQLSGEPLTLIESLHVASKIYVKAKELLTKAFASVITQQYETVKRLCDPKFNYNCYLCIYLQKI